MAHGNLMELWYSGGCVGISTLNRELYFKYFLYDKDGVFKKQLLNVISANINYSSLSKLKTNVNVTMAEDTDVDYLKDLIKIVCVIDGVETSMGQYIIVSPARDLSGMGVSRECECYSKLIIFEDDKVKTRYYVAPGTNIINEVKRIISANYDIIIADSLLTTSTGREWEPGTPKIDIINDLLLTANYTSLRVDREGNFTSTP